MSSGGGSREACRIHLQEELPQGRDPREVIRAFKASVNMTPEELEAWLGSEHSRRAVAEAEQPADRDGRHVARRIVELLRKDDELYWEADLRNMHQITQYVNCHRRLMANHPLSDLDCCHLKNFGFDPAKQAAEDSQPKEMRGLGGA